MQPTIASGCPGKRDSNPIQCPWPLADNSGVPLNAFPVPTTHTNPSTKVADALVDYLASRGLRHVFVVPGMQIDPLVKALAKHPTVTPIIANHELAAGYMADGYARACDGIGATFAIGGPGSANLIGAAAAARADRSAVLFVTGNIPFVAQGREEFQDAGPSGSNDVEVFRAALGVSLCCEQANELPMVLSQAARQLALRQPVHLAIAMDIQVDTGAFGPACDLALHPEPAAPASMPAPDWLACGRVLLVAGADALPIASVIAEAARTFTLAVASDASARGVVPEDQLHSLGHLGFMPHPRAGAALDGAEPIRADRIVALGCDDALTKLLGSRHPAVQGVEPTVFSEWLRGDPVLPDAAQQAARLHWLRQLGLVRRPSSRASTAAGEPMSYAQVVDAVAANMPPETCYAIDAGQVRRIAVSRLRCQQPRSVFVAEGMAPMGWSLGAAIGVHLARPERPVVALLGDGAMRMHGMELATAARYRLPILYVLFDNCAYGSVLARMGNEAEAATARLPSVDWCGFAAALGVQAHRADNPAALQRALTDVHSLPAPRLIVASVPAVEPDAYGSATGIDWGTQAP